MIINCLNISQVSISNYELFRNKVSEERRRKAERFYFKFDAYRSVCAELLLQYSLFEITNQYVEINLKYNKYGKPSIKNINNFFLICHIRGIGLCSPMEIQKLELMLKKF